MNGKKPLTEKQKYWLKHVRAAHESGLPLVRYAREHDLNEKSLWNWSWKFKQERLQSSEVSDPFVQVFSVSSSSQPTVVSSPTLMAQIRLSNGVEVHVPYRSEDLLVLLTQVSAL